MCVYLQSDSGFAGREQRCSEQLVLYAKIVSLLDSLSTSYGVELALTNYEEPPEQMKRGKGGKLGGREIFMGVCQHNDIILNLFWNLR